MIDGLWLPIVTPFRDGAVDFKSYERLIEHYLALGIDALFPLGTTGESPTLDEAETDELVERTLATVAGRVPVFVGVGGNATAKVEKDLKRLERHAFAEVKKAKLTTRIDPNLLREAVRTKSGLPTDITKGASAPALRRASR